MSDLILYFDIQNKFLAESLTSTSAFTIPPLVQNDNIAVRLYPLTPHLNVSAPYQNANLSGFNLSIAVSNGAPSGNPNAGVISYQKSDPTLTGHFRWVVDHWFGILYLNTLAVGQFIGNTYAKPSTLEIFISNG